MVFPISRDYEKDLLEMATKAYILEFGGYWREPNISGLPAGAGVYGVYACTYDARERTVSLRKLLYIGEAANMRDRVTGHERWKEWRKELRVGEQLCFNAAPIGPESDRQRAEAAMIYEHKPPCNVEYVDYFPYDATTITTKGQSALMRAHFAVYPTARGQTLLTGGLRRRW